MEQLTRVYFLPGMMCDERLFSSQIKALSTHAQCTVVGFERGESIEQYARCVIDQIRLDSQDDRAMRCNAGTPDTRVVIAGLSMGGIVAMQCLQESAGLIDAVILMDTNHLAEIPTRRALRLPQIKRVLDGELETVLIEEMKPLYLAPENQSDSVLLSLVLRMACDLGADVFARQSRAIMNRVDQSDTLSLWSGPAMIICGEHDRLCPPERHIMMQELMPHASLVVVPDAGHLPTLEAPDAVNNAMLEFIGSIP